LNAKYANPECPVKFESILAIADMDAIHGAGNKLIRTILGFDVTIHTNGLHHYCAKG
jgi:hypothetical protein